MDNYKEMLIDKNLYKRGFLLLKRQEKLPSIEGVIVYWEHRMGSWLSGAVLTISDFCITSVENF